MEHEIVGIRQQSAIKSVIVDPEPTAAKRTLAP
jgi:hypothetical protein